LDAVNIRALAIVTFLARNHATQGDAQALTQTAAYAKRGLEQLPKWQKPADLSDADFNKLHDQMTEIFAGAAGFAALQAKDYAAARGFYLKSVQLDPNNLQDVYQLGIACLSMNPPDKDGFWYIAKASNLAAANNSPAAQQSILNYGKAMYRKYHGGEDGWEGIVVAAGAAVVAPQPKFAAGIKPAPTPAELAVEAVKKYGPATLSFSDWEFVLGYRDASPANKQAADKVWKSILAKQKNGKAKLKMSVLVIAATADSIDAAVSDDNQQAKKVDLHVLLSKPLANPPAAGASVDVIGVFTEYRLNPFTFVMQQAEIAAPQAAPSSATH